MFARLGQVLCVVALVASAPAYAAEVWDCNYTTVPDALHKNPASGNVKFQIDGKTLTFQFSTPIDAQLRDALAGMLEYQVLEDNDAGLVAVNAVSRIAGQGPLVGASVVTINKSNGELHIGSVMQGGVHDLQHGLCKLNPAAP